MTNKWVTFVATLSLTALPMTGACLAQSQYPSKSVSLLFGFPAGSDIGARIVAEQLGQSLGQPVVVENVPGAAGNIAADRTASASADGHTVGLLTRANVVLRPLIFKSVPYDPLTKLVPVSQSYRFPNVLAVGNDVSAASVAALVDRARKQPGSLTFGHLCTGSVTHLSGELLKISAKVDMTELGYADFDVAVWFGLFLPSGTPENIVAQLSRDASNVVKRAEIQARFSDVGFVPVGSNPSEFRQEIAKETLLWKQLIADARIEPSD